MQTETSKQIEAKWEKVNISFYYFYDNSNTKNAEIMQVATWWIQKHNLPHFVRATTILELIEDELDNF
jgi:hypothetical protein